MQSTQLATGRLQLPDLPEALARFPSVPVITVLLLTRDNLGADARVVE